MDGNAIDSSGKGRHGTINGAVSSVDRFGIANSAMTFNGNEYIDCGAAWDFDRDFTVSLWIQSASYVLSKGIFTKTDAGHYWVARGFSITNINNPQTVYIWDSNGTSQLSFNTTLNSYPWTHLVVVRSGSNILTYFNNVYKGLVSVAGLGSINGSQNLFLGKGNGGGWTGSLDDVYIYNRALSATDVAELYNNGGPTTIRNAIIRDAVIR